MDDHIDEYCDCPECCPLDLIGQPDRSDLNFQRDFESVLQYEVRLRAQLHSHPDAATHLRRLWNGAAFRLASMAESSRVIH